MTTSLNTLAAGINNGGRVLVVCTGNICRSPAAEFLLARSQAFGPGTVIESAGVGAVVGSGVDKPMRAVLDRIGGVDTNNHVARQITPELIDSADLIITMSTRQLTKVHSMAPQAFGKAFTLRELAQLIHMHGRGMTLAELHARRSTFPRGISKEIADPYRRGSVAMETSVLEIIHAIEMITNVPTPADQLAVLGAKPLTVLSSAQLNPDRVNPYMFQLFKSLESHPNITYLQFSWRTALTGKVDVFHSHWPEVKIAGPSWFIRWKRRLAFRWMMRRFERRKTAVVQTMHNLTPHENQSAITEKLVRKFRTLEHMRIAINPTTPHDAGAPIETILHGHSTDWFSQYPKQTAEPGRVAYFGLIREYKGVLDLVRTFIETTEPLTLSISGNPNTEELAHEISSLANTDERIDVTFGYVDEPDLVEAITRATLIVLPYRELHNSGAALTALSLNRPVLVPRNESTDALAAEVGEQWVIRYDGPLTPDLLTKSAQQAPEIIASGAPDLSLRDWNLAGAQHAAVFTEAALRAKSKPSKNPPVE
jgi:beta-1,4-mannosyltransferase